MKNDNDGKNIVAVAKLRILLIIPWYFFPTYLEHFDGSGFCFQLC